ncbi:hypothetical protein ACQP3C_31005, partial [Escherichia coli]
VNTLILCGERTCIALRLLLIISIANHPIPSISVGNISMFTDSFLKTQSSKEIIYLPQQETL